MPLPTFCAALVLAVSAAGSDNKAPEKNRPRSIVGHILNFNPSERTLLFRDLDRNRHLYDVNEKVRILVFRNYFKREFIGKKGYHELARHRMVRISIGETGEVTEVRIGPQTD